MLMRRALRILLLAVVVPAAAPAWSQATAVTPARPEAAMEALGPEALVAKEDSVPVRAEAGFIHRELFYLAKGQEVLVDGRRGEWLHLRPEGWVHQDHLVTREALNQLASVELVVTRENARVRQTASTDAAILRTLGLGTEVQAKGRSGGWWQLADGGFIAEGLVREARTPAMLADDSGAPVPWVVSAASANVRSERSTTAPVVRKLVRGDIVAVAGLADGWCQVPDGWVRADLLQSPAPREPDAPPRRPRPDVMPEGMRRWTLVDLQGTVFEIVDLTRTPIIARVRQLMKATGVLETDWTYLGLTIGVPPDASYRFNYSPETNATVAVDIHGQKYGNVKLRGPVEKLPGDVRQFYLPMTVNPGEKFDGIILFRPTLKPDDIQEISMVIGGRLQTLYPATP